MNLGKRIRELRKKKGFTLVGLSRKSGVAVATLSRIETGRMTGTLESHMRIAKVFEMTLPEFYSEVDKAISVHKKDEHADKFVHDKKASSIILTKDIFTKKMLPCQIQLQVGGRTQTEKLKKGAEKFVYVLQGQVEIVIGDAKNTLEKGETLYFDASYEHYIRNTGTTDAEALCVVTPAIL